MCFYSIGMQQMCYNSGLQISGPAVLRTLRACHKGVSSVEPQSTTKRCSVCNQDRPVSAYGKMSKARDGLRPECKECRKKASKDYYWRDPELQRHKLLERRKQNPNYMRRYSREPTRCAACGAIKTISDFGADRRRKSGLNPYCKTCLQAKRAGKVTATKERGQRWYLKQQGLTKERARQWAKANPERRTQVSRRHASKRRAWKRNSPGEYTLAEWTALCERYDFHCLRCKRRAPDIDLTADHVLPLSKGGSNLIDNIQPLCLHCNLSKNARHIDYRPGWQP